MFAKHIAPLILLVALANGCTLTVTPPPPVDQPSPNTVIFTAEQTADMSDLLTNVLSSTPENTWTPTADHVAQLEVALPAFMQDAENQWLRPDPPIEQRLPDYTRQYFGIVENGEEIIYANFLCHVDQSDWRKEYILVLDGGDCFFQLKFNPTRGEFFDLRVNGES